MTHEIPCGGGGGRFPVICLGQLGRSGITSTFTLNVPKVCLPTSKEVLVRRCLFTVLSMLPFMYYMNSSVTESQGLSFIEFINYMYSKVAVII